jgi:hypothetical protein
VFFSSRHCAAGSSSSLPARAGGYLCFVAAGGPVCEQTVSLAACHLTRDRPVPDQRGYLASGHAAQHPQIYAENYVIRLATSVYIGGQPLGIAGSRTARQ